MRAAAKAGPDTPLQPFKVFTTQLFSSVFSQYFCYTIHSHKNKSCIFGLLYEVFNKNSVIFPSFFQGGMHFFVNKIGN